jgi:DNA modification methylase
MTATIIRGDALNLPLADQSVDLICTSPPYFALRSYTDGGQHYAGQLGSEPTPLEYVDALIAATREMVRVLKPCGSIWVNLGDKYAGGGQGGNVGGNLDGGEYLNRITSGARKVPSGLQAKSLMGIPWRYALACIDQLGLILRRDQIWAKPNGLPESADDRSTSAHEYWFHLVKQPRYFSAVDEIREAHHPNYAQKYPNGQGGRGGNTNRNDGGIVTQTTAADLNPLGKLPRSWWVIPTEPLIAPKWRGEEPGHPHAYFFGKDHDEALVDAEKWRRRFPGRTLTRMVDHFAAYPTEWPRRIIAGWTPPGICVECGQGRRPVTDKGEYRVVTGAYKAAAITAAYTTGRSTHGQGASTLGYERNTAITGYTCACQPLIPVTKHVYEFDYELGEKIWCDRIDLERDPNWVPPPTRPAVVVDPFGGTGTTALVADVLGMHGISVDLSADYCRLARWRTQDPGQRARAARVDKPPPVIDGQLDLLGGTP